jgi:hypothetical protein
MTTRVLIFAYIAFVLALSGFANASSHVTYISKAEVNQTSGILSAHGQMSTPCQTRPAVVVKKIDETGARIEIEVTSTPTADVCVEMLGPEFDTALDLKELPLSDRKTYSIIIENAHEDIGELKYEARSLGENEKAFRVDKRSFKGVLVYLSNPTMPQNVEFALNDGKQSVPVVSPQINLERFRNNQVWLSGYVVEVGSLYVDSDHGMPSMPQPHSPVVIVPVSISDLKK